MRLTTFLTLVKFSSKKEIERIALLTFFDLKIKSKETFTLSEMGFTLQELGFARPNASRLKDNLLKSKDFVRVSGTTDTFKLHLRVVERLEREFPEISSKSEEVISDDTILPEGLYKGTRGYLENLAKQINASYENRIYDGCAILMRRMFEILLVLTYRHLGREHEIQDADGYKNLSTIINYTKSNRVVTFQKETEEVLDDFRQIGNFSAHKIQYNCKKGDIDKIRLPFRAAVEELLYQSGIKK